MDSGALPTQIPQHQSGAERAIDIAAPRSVPRRIVRSRHRDRDFTLRRALVVADVIALEVALVLALLISGLRPDPFPEALWLLPILPAWIFVFRTYGLYRRPIRSFEPSYLDDVSAILHSLLIGTLGLWLFYKLLPVPKLNFEEMLFFGIFSLTLVLSLRSLVRRLNLRLQGPERVFAVAPTEDLELLQRKLGNHPEYEMELVGAVASEPTCERLGLRLSCELDELESLMKSGGIDHLLVRLDGAYVQQTQMLELMHICHQEGVRFGCFPGVRNLLLPGVEVNHIEGMGILTTNPAVFSRTSWMLKRALDITVSALLLVLLALPMALIALAIRLDSKGSPIYRQVRVGRDAKRFDLFKFRTMVSGADDQVAELMAASTDPHWLVLDKDPRVTRVGRFLRHSSIDELPQLWNVLKGDMSLVGPRPLPLRDDEIVKGWARHRLDLVPGMTGYWQVLGRNSIPFREMVEIDYAYVASWSLWQDIKLLMRTLPIVLRKRGVN
jgi:exopolysaccharide biosynthesis polyprenyl glycosylphosphotransferase